MYDYEKLSSTQLLEKLKNFTEQLEELEEERQFVLGQTGYNLSCAAVKKYEIEVSEL
jgi:seryl-tRNA synthetase